MSTPGVQRAVDREQRDQKHVDERSSSDDLDPEVVPIEHRLGKDVDDQRRCQMQETMEHSALENDVVPHRGGLSDDILELADDDPPCDDVYDDSQRNNESDLDRRGHEGDGLAAEALLEQPVA